MIRDNYLFSIKANELDCLDSKFIESILVLVLGEGIVNGRFRIISEIP